MSVKALQHPAGPRRVYKILLVEDSAPDVELMRFLFDGCDVNAELLVARDGIEATEMLFGEKRVAADLILMDLNVPRRDGKELLKEIKGHADLCRTPVVIVSTSTGQREVSEAYCLGANSFLAKPTDLDEYQASIRSFVEFWLRRIKLPTGE